MNRKVWIRLIIMMGGLGIIILSLFAFQLGLDNDPGWGPRRFQILGAGVVTVLFGASYWITPVLSRLIQPIFASSSILQNTQDPAGTATSGSRTFRTLERYPKLAWISRYRVELWLILITICVLWCYVWIITIGRMEKWPSGRDYYWLLTQAFQHGQTALLVEPNPELLALENPYDLDQRRGLDYPWDITLYNGKYYLYWGPVPAVVGVLVNLVTSRPVTDAGLVFSFVFGTALFAVLLLRKLYQDGWFPEWVFWGAVIASFLNMPLVWLFTHPAYYEASIAGGQFFIMAGFYLLYLAVRSPSLHVGWMTLSALAFGLAGGTRINLLFSVLFIGLVMLLRILSDHRWKVRLSFSALMAVSIPLLIVVISLFWYNYARFGSILEFGHRYQLTGLASTADYGDQFSIKYMLPSLYSYIFRAPAFRAEFPFVTVPAIKEKMWPFFINPPENYYYAEPLAGILLTVPLIGFTGFLLLRLFWLFINGDVSAKRSETRQDGRAGWFGIALAGYVLIQFIFLLVYVSASMRYLFDVSTGLIILASMFVGTHVRAFEENPVWRKTIRFLWLSMAGLTAVSGFLIGITGGQNNFLNKNPQLYSQLFDWFSR